MAQRTGFNRSRWIRGQVILKPSIGLEEMCERYDAEGFPAKHRPNVQHIYNARNQLLKRWGVESLDALPRYSNGRLVLSDMLNLYFSLRGDKPNEKIMEFFDADMLAVKEEEIEDVRKTGDWASPDANQSAGPRAGAPESAKKTKKRQRRSRRNKDDDIFEMLMKTKKYAESVGGVEHARVLLKYLEEIQSIPK